MHPFRHGAPFLLLTATSNNLGTHCVFPYQAYIIFLFLPILPASSLAVCGHPCSPRITIYFSILPSMLRRGSDNKGRASRTGGNICDRDSIEGLRHVSGPCRSSRRCRDHRCGQTRVLSTVMGRLCRKALLLIDVTLHVRCRQLF